MHRTSLDLSLYLVTDTDLCGAFGVPETVVAAVAAGVTVVQLRDPACSDEDFVALGRAVVAALSGSGVPLLVNDRVHLVDAIGAHGAHVGQGDLDIVAARQTLGPQGYLGLSVQTLPDVAAARRTGTSLIDYLGAGPVWPQSTKPDAAAPTGLEGLAAITAGSPWPCVAIGGVGAGRVHLARRAGAAGVAVVSAICGQPDPGEAARRLRQEWDSTG
ncbi:MAG: thiamine phosphate synthase [Actinomycetes bacterium]